MTAAEDRKVYEMLDRIREMLPIIPHHTHSHGCGHNGEGITPEYQRGWSAGRAHLYEKVCAVIAGEYDRLSAQPSPQPVESVDDLAIKGLTDAERDAFMPEVGTPPPHRSCRHGIVPDQCEFCDSPGADKEEATRQAIERRGW